jgi:hypothetical protein
MVINKKPLPGHFERVGSPLQNMTIPEDQIADVRQQLTWLIVSGRSKPARDGRMKTSHFDVDVALVAVHFTLTLPAYDCRYTGNRRQP